MSRAVEQLIRSAETEHEVVGTFLRKFYALQLRDPEQASAVLEEMERRQAAECREAGLEVQS